MKLAIQENMIPGETLSEKLWNIEKYGFEGVEIWGNELPRRLKEIKEALSTSKIKLSTICSGYGGDLLGADRKSRETAMKDIKERLKICADLGGIGVITVPTFSGPKISDLYPLYSDVREIEKKILIEECKILGEYADDVGAYILLEPLNRYESHLINRLQQAVEICKAVGREYVKIMADLFHMNIEEANIPKSIEEAEGYILHVHLADSNRLLPGYGHIDFKSGFDALKKIGYKNFMTLECQIPGKPEIELPKCVKYLKSLI
ncbi:MAG TPA: sugar phosphate isomerase/epimerase [Candidatus Bathyarchaeota archaeon]|nr:sugar phosphate isomerase/epimerase [Candidatus Bathyarchaeota archaeon]